MKTHCAAVVTAAWLFTGCATFQDNMRAGRYYEACEQILDDVGNAARFDAWLQSAAQAHTQLVPLSDVESWVGGPLAQYGREVGVYRVSGEVKGARVTVGPRELGVDVAWLVAMLPPLVVLKEPLVPPGPYEDADFAPEPPPEPAGGSRRHRPGMVEGLADAFFGMFLGIGQAVGAAVGAVVTVPLALTVGMVMGGVQIVSGIQGAYHPFYGHNPFRGNESVRYSSYRVDPAPIFELRPGKVTGRADALLNEQDHRRVVEAMTSQLNIQRALVEAEQGRRVRFASGPPPGLLGCDAQGKTCTAVLRPGKVSVRLVVDFQRGKQTCGPFVLNVQTQAAMAPEARALWPTPTAPSPITLLDATAPAWMHETPARTTVPALATTAANRLEHAVCVVTLPQAAGPRRKPKTGAAHSRPAVDLVVRVTAGRDYPRVMRWALGPVTDEARFLIPGLGLEPGERLRLAFHAKGARSLGGGIVEFTGALPLHMRNEALSVRCDAADEPAMSESARRESEAFSSSLDALGAALLAEDAAALVQHRNAARRALLQWVHHAGWANGAVAAGLARLAAEDPSEKHSAHPMP